MSQRPNNLDDLLSAIGYSDAVKPTHVEHWDWEKRLRMFARLGYVPSPGQEQFHRSTARFKVLCAGSRFGKSISAAREVLDLVLTPNTKGWCVGPSYALAEKEWEYLVADLERLGAMEYATRVIDGPAKRLEFSNGSKIWTKSAETPRSLLGDEVDWMIIGEASQIDVRVMQRFLRARLGSRLGRQVIPTTPAGLGWVKELWLKGQISRSAAVTEWESTTESWKFSVIENPTFSEREYLAAKAEMPAPEFSEQYDGNFTTMTGRVFPMFRDDLIVDGDVPPQLRDAPVYRTLDFGYTSPTCCLWVVFDRFGTAGAPPNTYWFVAELYQRKLGVHELAAAMEAHEWSRTPRQQSTIGDMADLQKRTQLSTYGIECKPEVSRLAGGKLVPIDKAIEAGLSTVRTIMHQGRIRVHASCVNLIRELRAYVYEENSELPAADQDDHAIDPMRYLLHSIEPNAELGSSAAVRREPYYGGGRFGRSRRVLRQE